MRGGLRASPIPPNLTEPEPKRVISRKVAKTLSFSLSLCNYTGHDEKTPDEATLAIYANPRHASNVNRQAVIAKVMSCNEP